MEKLTSGQIGKTQIAGYREYFAMNLHSRTIPRVFAFLCFILFSVGSVRSVAAETFEVCGTIFDGSTGLPLSNANIGFWKGDRMHTAIAGLDGLYSVDIPEAGFYDVLVYHRNPDTSDIDYIPAHGEVQIQRDVQNLSFSIFPGASINVAGEMRLYRDLQSPLVVHFTVVYASGARANTTCYRQDSIIGSVLGFGERTLFVPCDVPIKVQVDVLYSDESRYHFSIDDQGDFLVLSKGSSLSVNLDKEVLLKGIGSCNEYAYSTQELIEQAESVGFYVSYERGRLRRAKNDLEAAGSSLEQEDFDETLASLRQGYLTLRNVEEDMTDLFSNASVSAAFITPFLCLSSMAIALLISQKGPRRLVASLLTYAAILFVLFKVYPGYVMLGIPNTVLLACASFLAIRGITHGLPRISRRETSGTRVCFVGAINLALSIAARDLRRRRLRTSLTLSLLVMSVFAFIALTSFSLEHGFATEVQIRHQSGQRQFDGFLIKKPSEGETLPFEPISHEIYSWLEAKSEAVLVAVKIENIPREYSLGLVSSPLSQTTLYFSGMIGVAPSTEPKVTGLDRIVMQGRFLDEEDKNGVLLSKAAAERLEVKINDTVRLFERDFALVGIFNGENLERQVDLDGTFFTPYMLDIEGEYENCRGEDTIILHYEVAQDLPDMGISRIAVQIEDTEKALALARQAVLKWTGVEACVLAGRTAYRLFVGSYYIADGFAPAMVPLGIVTLNVGVLMWYVVHERKNELMILSTLGLNPFHITALFLSEALIIGIVGGGLGYLLGMGSYHLMFLSPSPPEVKYKAELSWGIAALLTSITSSCLGSLLPALKSSTISTPSLVRRWRIEEKARNHMEPWVLSLPIRLKRIDLNAFFTFMENHLKKYRFEHGFIGGLKVTEKGDYEPTKIELSFACFNYERRVKVENTITSTETLIPDLYIIRLTCLPQGTRSNYSIVVWQIASSIRNAILLYVDQKRR